MDGWKASCSSRFYNILTSLCVIMLLRNSSFYTLMDIRLTCHWKWQNIAMTIVLYFIAYLRTQPCDVSFFGPMKSAWKKEVKVWQVENVGQAFTTRHFAGVFKITWQCVAKFENAVHGYQNVVCFHCLRTTSTRRSERHRVYTRIAKPNRFLSCVQSLPPLYLPSLARIILIRLKRHYNCKILK